MTTKRAMAHLQALVELDERAEAQMEALANTLRQVIVQMDAILDDADQSVSETLAEQTTGLETQFVLARSPVKANSVVLKLDGATVAKVGYTVAGNIVTPVAAIPAGKTLRAEYVILGLKTQTAALLVGMDDLDVAYFATRKAKYGRAIAWIEGNA